MVHLEQNTLVCQLKFRRRWRRRQSHHQDDEHNKTNSLYCSSFGGLQGCANFCCQQCDMETVSVEQQQQQAIDQFETMGQSGERTQRMLATLNDDPDAGSRGSQPEARVPMLEVTREEQRRTGKSGRKLLLLSEQARARTNFSRLDHNHREQPQAGTTKLSTYLAQFNYYYHNHNCNNNRRRWTSLIMSAVILYTIFITLADAIAPTIDYSHNMRILKLPKSTQLGSLIYRLRGSDGDPNSQLIFGVSGIEGRALLDIVPVARSWNEADVYLRAPLEASQYNLTIYVTDGNKTTQVESTILVTDDPNSNSHELHPDDLLLSSHQTNKQTQQHQHQNHQLLPFINPRHIFHVPENTQPDEPIGFVTALESQKSDLPVRFELRGKGSDKFSIKYVFGPKGQSRADIVLAQPVDYERQNLFNLKVLALNAWTDARLDTRNVASMDIVITVGDVQDSPPVFKNLPQALYLANNMKPGDLVAKLAAEDGDYGDQRAINYALDANSPLATYFSLNKSSGELRLIKPINELALHAAWASSGSWSVMNIFASEQPDPSSYDHLWPPMFAKVELPLVLVDLINEAPQFVGGWQSGLDSQENRILHGYLNEQQASNAAPAAEGEPIRWFTNYTTTSGSGGSAASNLFDELIKSMNGRPSVVDLGLGANGTFELSLEGPDAELFRLDPVLPVSKQSTFTIMVAPNANRTLFDRESSDHSSSSSSSDLRPKFNFDLVARDFGTVERKSSRIKCSIELVDSNDNAPQFDASSYLWSVYENAPVGQLLGSVRARDPDSGNGARVRYTALTGHDQQMFHLDPENGHITLNGHLDREKKNIYLLVVEARDFSGAGNANYSQLVINVLDVNDNAPVFLQAHYDAVLLADGTFHQPLVVRALDADEPGTANSQVAYEIIAGNQNEQFSIDAVSGVIYPISGSGAGGGHESTSGGQSDHPPQIPPALLEPIAPYGSSNQQQANSQHPQHPQHHREQPEAAGKILPNLEVEGAPRNRSGSGPYGRHQIRVQTNQDAAGDIQPRSLASYGSGGGGGTYEIESNSSSSRYQSNTNRSGYLGDPAASLDREQLPALDLLLNLESEQQATLVSDSQTASNHQKRALLQAAASSSASSGQQLPTLAGATMRLPPITTLVVRAHDFGIPLRSSTVKVNIYNQALLSRSVSVILNGTAEQLELRREAIERAFGSIIGSRASIESIDALSESSSISVARIRLAVPQHSLVDLTDLSALMAAIDYHPHLTLEQQQQLQQRNHIQGPQPHYYGLIPVNNMSSNMSQPQNLGHHLYSDINSFALDANNQLERRLLIYIIIVGVCILALLVIWMIYSCSRETESHVKIIEKSIMNEPHPTGNYKSSTTISNRNQLETGHKFVGGGGGQRMDKTQAKTTMDNSTHSAIGNNLAKCRTRQPSPQRQLDGQSTISGHPLATMMMAGAGSELMQPTTTLIKPDHYSMYNGQVWFGPGGANPIQIQKSGGGGLAEASERRVSSAPSATSLDSALHSAIQGGRSSALGPRQATGQFFPNTIGYMENLASMSADQMHPMVDYGRNSRLPVPPGGSGGQYYTQETVATRMAGGRRHRRRKVAPMVLNGYDQPHWLVPAAGAPNKPPRHSPRGHANAGGHTNEAFVQDLELGTRGPSLELGSSGPHPVGGGSSRLLSSAMGSGSNSSGTNEDDDDAESLVLNSDQELLGFDSSGTPIIASHQRQVVAKRTGSTAAATTTTRRPVESGDLLVAPPAGGGTISPASMLTNQGAEQGTREVGPPPDGATTAATDTRAAAVGGFEGAGLSGGTRPHSGSGEGAAKPEASPPQLAKTTKQHQKEEEEPQEVEGGKRQPGVDLMGELNDRLARRRKSSADQTGRPAPDETSRVRGRLERAGSADSGASGSGGGGANEPLNGMLNRELLEKQSIFAITYSGLATDKLPA